MSAFDTPLQLQIWASSASSATPTSAVGPPRSNISSTRCSGSGRPRSNACCRNATLRLSPSSVAPTILSSRITIDLKTPLPGSEKTMCSSVSRSGSVRPMAATSTPATLSLVAVREPRYAARGFRPVITSASTAACSHSGATRPYTSPRCCTHSPTAYTSSSSTVRRWSSTTIARSTVKPLVSATSLFGRMPAATTIRSQSIVVSSRSRTPRTLSGPQTAVVRLLVTMPMPSEAMLRRSTSPPSRPSWAFISQRPECTTSTASPWLCRPRAASRPSRPPPITTALRWWSCIA